MKQTYMISDTKLSVAILAISFLAACSGTERYVEAPLLRVSGSNLAPAQALEKLFTSQPAPYRIALCQAEPKTAECPDKDANPTATGVGGLFLPLAMELRNIDVETLQRNGKQINIETSLDAPVNKIPSACGTVNGFITMNSPTSAALELPASYCNWMVIGNVAQSVSLSIDHIDLNEYSFTGFYKISFYGTGNANGSGYYKAKVLALPLAMPSGHSVPQ